MPLPFEVFWYNLKDARTSGWPFLLQSRSVAGLDSLCGPFSRPEAMRLSHGDTPLSIRVPLSRALLESAEILTALQACQLLLTHHLPTVGPIKRAYPAIMRFVVQVAGRRTTTGGILFVA
jgi:hypothetical protein